MKNEISSPAKRQKTGAAAVVVYIVFGILAFAFSLCTAGQVISRNILARSVVSETVSEMNPADWELGLFWKEQDIGDFVKKWRFPKTITADSTIAEALKDTTESLGDHIETEDVRKMFEETEIMPSLGSLIAHYERYLLTGVDEDIYSPGEVMERIKGHLGGVQDSLGVDFSALYLLIEILLKDVAPAFDELNPARLLNNAGAYTSAAVGLPMIAGTAALSLAMFAIAFIITKRLFPCVRMYGVSLGLVGVVTFAAAKLLPVLLRGETSLRYNAVNYITKEFNLAFAGHFYTTAAVFAAVGVVLVIGSTIGSALSKRKTQTPQTSA